MQVWHTAGIHCDITVGNSNAVFNSTVMGHLASIDSRFAPLVRLVKLWARAEGINDSSRGTFNSYALTLMVSKSTAIASTSETATTILSINLPGVLELLLILFLSCVTLFKELQ